jgi:hypothetical protein
MNNSPFGDDIIRKIKARLAELRLETLRAKVKHNLSKAFQGVALGYCRWCGKTQSRQGVKCYYCGEHNSVVVKPTTKSANRVPQRL